MSMEGDRVKTGQKPACYCYVVPQFVCVAGLCEVGSEIYICISFSFCGKVTDTGRGLTSGIPRPRPLVAHIASDIERWPGDTRLHTASESVRSNYMRGSSRTHNARYAMRCWIIRK
jgi:hypothetical protein